jgi:predicted ABC-type ATPase
MPHLYIIAGCNGTGKTTAAYSMLPETFKCIPFVNADEIARGFSPFQPEVVAIHAGRIMLQRIDELIALSQDFAFETTMSSKSYIQTIKKAQAHNYHVTLLYFWLDTPQLAINRIRERVAAGGHHVPDDVVTRRHERSLNNFINNYRPLCDYWLMMNNSGKQSEIIDEVKANKTFDTDSLREKMLEGIKISFEKLVKGKAKNDDELVFSENGQIVRIKAKDILKEFNY